MMRGDTLTAGISRFHGCCSFSTYMNTECAAIYSLADYGKGVSVSIQLEGINLTDLGLLERDTSLEPDHEVDWLVTRINY